MRENIHTDRGIVVFVKKYKHHNGISAEMRISNKIQIWEVNINNSTEYLNIKSIFLYINYAVEKNKRTFKTTNQIIAGKNIKFKMLKIFILCKVCP